MSQIPSNSSTASFVAANRQQMEICIDEMAGLVRTSIPPSQFLGEALKRIQQVTGARIVRFWRPTATGTWETAGQLPNELEATDERLADTGEIAWLVETAHSQQLSTRKTDLLHNGGRRREARTICPIVHGGQSVGLFDVVLDHDPIRDVSPDIVPFLNAICEIVADFLSQAELRQLKQARAQWQQWDQFSLALMKSTDFADLAATIVNDGRLLADCDRVTLLRHSGSRVTAVAISGVAQIEARSNTVASLNSVAKIVAAGNQPVWFNAASPDRETTAIQELADHVRLVGTRMIGLIPVPAETSTEDSQKKPTNRAVLAFEQFQDVSDVSAWRSRAELLAQRCQPLLLATLDRESIPFFATLQKWRCAPAWLSHRRLLPAILLVTLLVSLLTFVRSEFTVSGIAELVPDHRREIFASRSGIVDQLLVQHGDDVEVDQPLVVLRDPQLEMELPKIIGELEVVRERLKGVLAVRLAGGAGADAANRARQLTSEEEELKERQQSLNRQRLLTEQQQSALTLRSPIRGKILTWDVSTLLSARPVERGQSLLTVGDTTGPWVVEMRIADKDFGHVRRAQKRLKPNLDVDFLLVSDPAHSYRGTIRDVSETTHLDDQIGVSVRVTVAVEPDQIPNPHAGTTAIPRIRCGRHSIGYVWLHELIDAVWTRLLF